MNLRSFLTIVLPSLCLACRTSLRGDGVVCDNCLGTIAISRTLFCGRCRSRLPEGAKICHRDFPYLLGAAAEYRDDVLRTMIHGLKFQGIRIAADPLAHLLVRYVKELPFEIKNFLAVPVPLGQRRERERGFNHADLIGRTFARHLHVPYLVGNLRRIRNTPPQSDIGDYEERRRNLKGCFAVSSPAAFGGKNIVLIDDVTTSGATFLEAASALKGAGVRTVLALAVASA